MKTLYLLCGLALFLLSTGCEDILEVPDISNERVQLLAPSDSTTVTVSNVSFSWNGVPEASLYHIQVATPNFGHAAQIVVDSIIVLDSTFLGTRMARDLPDSTYEWRVRAMNSDYGTEYTTNLFHVAASD